MLVTYHVISGNYYQIDIVVVERTCTSALGWFSISKRILLKTNSLMLEVKVNENYTHKPVRILETLQKSFYV